jgi:very-short-patch-repair endonuclease
VGIFVCGKYLSYMEIIVKESQYKWLILEAKMKGNDEFITKAQNVHKDSNGNPLYDYSLVDYQGAQTKVKIICPRHKDEWKKSTGNEYFEITPNHHLNGRGCRYDYLEKKTKYSDEDILNVAKKYKSASDFKTNDLKMWYVAMNRSKEDKGFYKTISTHFERMKGSYGEDVVANILVKKELIPEECILNKCDFREKTFDDCFNSKQGRYCRELRFDFYLPNQNTLIEYDGEQHFVKRGKYGEKFETLQENDIIKNKYCKDRDIKLIRIHYKVPFNEIEGLLFNELKSTKQEILIGPY